MIFRLGIYKAKHGILWNDKVLANVCLKLIPKILCVSTIVKNMKHFLLQSYKISKKTLILFQIQITFFFSKIKSLAVYIETLKFYYLLLQHVEEYMFDCKKYFSK